MSNTRIPSPARSLGGGRTPRRYLKRGPRSLGSPARSNTPGRLTSIVNINENIVPFAVSPLPSRRSVLTDSTYIQEPRRKSWWREIDENSGDVLDVLESATGDNTNNAIEEVIDMEVLSQEKNNLLDLPEISDSESINSIVLPQRNLFMQKKLQPQKKFVQLFSNRDSLAKLQKFNCGDDKSVIAPTKNLFQNKKQQTKIVFPAALLSISPNKTTDDISIGTNIEVPKSPVRNIFNKHPPIKRKNMFAEFIITESEDEITEIEPKIFEFHKRNSGIAQPLQNRMTTSSTTDTEMEDWTHLPSSTMVDNQIQEVISITPQKKSRMSKLSEAKESEVGTNSDRSVDKTKQSNKSLKNTSLNSSKNKGSSFRNNESLLAKANSIMLNKNTLNHIESNQSLTEIRKEVYKSQSSQSLQHMSIRNFICSDITTGIYKDSNQIIQKPATELSNNTTNDINKEAQNESPGIVNTENLDNNEELDNEVDDNNFTLQYDDEGHSPVVLDKLNEVINLSVIHKSVSSQLETDKFKEMEKSKDVRSEVIEFIAVSNNIEESKQESIDNEESQIQDVQGREIQTVSGYNLINSKEAQNCNLQEVSEEESVDDKESQTRNNQDEEDHNISDHDMVYSEEAQNISVEDDDEVEKTLIDESDKNKEEEQNEDSDNIENCLSVQNESNETLVEEHAKGDDDDIVQEPGVDEQDVEKTQSDDEYENNEEDASESSNNENQYSDEDRVVEPTAENENEVEEEECEDVVDKIETSNDAKSPEVILHDRTNQVDSLMSGQTSTRNNKSMLLKSPNIKRSMAKVQDVTEFSDGSKNSSAENSYWDSHRTTRKTLRQTLGKGFSPRKSLRTLVMEKSVKRQTAQMEMHWDTAKLPQANSTELPGVCDQDLDDDEYVEQSVHEISKRTRQATLEMCFQKMKKKNMEQRLKIEEAVRHSFKPIAVDKNLFKVPKNPISWNKRLNKPTQNKSRVKEIKSLIPLDDLPPEILEDLKYKPPKRFKPSNASWITPSLYKFLENKLEAKYDYKARVRAEKLVETIYEFTKNVKRHEIAPTACVQILKHEMARLDIVKTHFDFYNFFHEFMPREIRVKVVPDIVNKISLPKDGIFTNIIRE